MTIYELLEELEEIINVAPKLPLTGKIMVDANEILDIAKDIRLSFPDDVQQAEWIRREKNTILDNARNEYEKIIIDAKKQVDMMVEKDVITERAVDVSGEIYRRADEYSKNMRLRTYAYMDDVLNNFRVKIDELNNKYFDAMYNDMNAHFSDISKKLDSDIKDIRSIAEETQNTEIEKHRIDIPIGESKSEEE